MFAIILPLVLTIVSQASADTESATECPANYVLCFDGQTCILEGYICNSRDDCPWGTDEIKCEEHTCIEGYRKCSNGKKCIHYSWICDGENDCPDGDDEDNCEDTEQPLFALVDSEGSDIEGEQLGLLLYKGGTVCDDYFDTSAANAICRHMGYTDATRWTSDENFNIQSNFEINLDDVDCRHSSMRWDRCSFSEDHNCGHNEDVFLSCNSEEEEESPTADESAPMIWITAQHDVPSKFDTDCDLKVITAGSSWSPPSRGGPPSRRNWNGNVKFLVDDLEMLLIGLHPKRGKLAVRNNVFRRGTLVPMSDYRWVGATYPEADDEGKREYTFQFTPTGFVLKCADMTLITIPYDELTDDREEFLSSINSIKFELKLSPDKGPISLQYARSMCQDKEQLLFTLVDSEGSVIEGEQLGLLLYKGGTVCDDDFDMEAGDVICKLMGYSYAIQWTNTESFDIQTDYEITLDDVYCRSWVVGEWGSCTFSEDHNCKHIEDVFLSCSY